MNACDSVIPQRQARGDARGREEEGREGEGGRSCEGCVLCFVKHISFCLFSLFQGVSLYCCRNGKLLLFCNAWGIAIKHSGRCVIVACGLFCATTTLQYEGRGVPYYGPILRQRRSPQHGGMDFMNHASMAADVLASVTSFLPRLASVAADRIRDVGLARSLLISLLKVRSRSFVVVGRVLYACDVARSWGL
jgi:hypothetical protein